MPNVAIVTDSIATIPDEMLQSLNIHWVPNYIHHGNEVLRDLVNITRQEFYRWLPFAKDLPKTANPGPGDYESLYQELVAEGAKEIISIHMSSKSSGAFQAATIAKETVLDKLPQLKIEIIDTFNVSMCHGWMVIEAAREALKGSSLAAVAERARSLIPKTQMLQTADTAGICFYPVSEEENS